MDFFTPGHLVVVAVVAVVVLVGWKRLPEMSRSVGRSLRIFKTEMKALDTDGATDTDTRAPLAGSEASSAATSDDPAPAAVGVPSVDGSR